MKVSLNTIKQFTQVEISVDELVSRINQQLGGVSDVVDMSKRYDGAVIVKVESCEKHPNADKLSVCMVDDGSNQLTQVVCGAPNVRAGMFAVWLKPGATVPATFEDKEPFVLGARELRGIMSNGMLASPKELGLGESHDGILEIQPADNIYPGISFASATGLDDTIIDIENKMFTHRPDLFGQLGVAREIAGIQGRAFGSPDWYMNYDSNVTVEASSAVPLSVFNDADTYVPRFTSVVVSNITVAASPLWLQTALIAMGGKPINNVVDVTNYMMLLTAQPTHAYDYDKLRGGTIGARMATEGESVTLLNGKSYSLESTDIVIADSDGPIGLAGIMGGGNSEVSPGTKMIVLEVANFDMYTLRKSSMRHGVFTDALTRFNKGQSPYQTIAVLRQLIRYIQDLAGGSVASQIYDIGNGYDRSYDGQSHLESRQVQAGFINERLGTELTSDSIATLLQNVEFDVAVDGSQLTYRAPYWRTDIVEAEDIVEEVGRLYGFDKLPRVLPTRSARPAAKNQRRELKSAIRKALAQAGANEVLTYSFVHERLLTKSGQNPELAYRLSNALSPDLQYYRLSLTPSLLDKIAPNQRGGYDTFALFELGKSHLKGKLDEQDAVPAEDELLAFVVASTKSNGTMFYTAKRYFETIFDTTGFELSPLAGYEMADELAAVICAPYEPNRSMVIVKDGELKAVVGEFKQDVRTAFKLPMGAAGFEVYLDALVMPRKTYRPLSKFPGTSKDISIKVPADLEYAKLYLTVSSTLNALDKNYVTSLAPVSIYQSENDETKTISFRIAIVNNDRTLTDSEANEIVKKVAEACTSEHSAVIV